MDLINLKEAYSGKKECDESGIVSPSYAVVDPLTMMIAAINAVVALKIFIFIFFHDKKHGTSGLTILQ